MADEKQAAKRKGITPDWLVQGVLTKVGDTFDRLTGRKWRPSSSLATSELTNRLKAMLDSEAIDVKGKGRVIPHHVQLKMQWNKFSADSEDHLKRLENELTAAAIDHINDSLYLTYKPLKIEVKPDYFTEGVRFITSFDEFGDGEREAVMNVTMPVMKVQDLIPELIEEVPDHETYVAEFSLDGKQKTAELKFAPAQRLSVGRTKGNDLALDDTSVSKAHASLALNAEGQLVVADTGSTNGTFVNEQRIAYGRAVPINEGDKLKFGAIDVFLRHVPRAVDFATREEYETEQISLPKGDEDQPEKETVQSSAAEVMPSVATVIDKETNMVKPTEPVIETSGQTVEQTGKTNEIAPGEDMLPTIHDIEVIEERDSTKD